MINFLTFTCYWSFCHFIKYPSFKGIIILNIIVLYMIHTPPIRFNDIILHDYLNDILPIYKK